MSYFASLRVAASFAGPAGSNDETNKYDSAEVWVTVTSQNASPFFRWIKVRPSGRLPSERDKLEGSLIVGIWALANA